MTGLDEHTLALAALAASPTAMLAFGPDARVVLANPAADALLGGAEGGLVGRDVDAVLAAGGEAAPTSAALRALAARAVGTGPAGALAFTDVRGSAERWLEVRAVDLGELVAVHLDDRTAARVREIAAGQTVAAGRGAIFTLDGEGRILSANPAASAMVGLPPAELVGRSVEEWLDVDPRAARAGSFPAQTIVRRGDGATSSADLLALHGDGVVPTLVVRDSFERDQMLAQLADSEAQYREVFASMPIGLWVVRRRDLVVVDANDTVLRLGGRTRDDVVGQPLAGLASDEPARQLADLVRSGRQLEDVPHRLARSDGEELHLRLTTRAFEVEGEGYILLLVADATARWKAERSREEVATRFREIASGIREVFFFTDPATGRLTYVSPAFAEIWGWAPDMDDPDGFRTRWRASMHPDDVERVTADLIERQVRGGYDERYRIVRPDGSTRWVHSRAFPVHGESGGVERIVGVAEDITKRRELGAQVQQAQKMESLGRLAGGVAHDFNNWLTVIVGNAELIETEVTEGEAAEILQEVRAATERASGLTRQLLAFSGQDVVEKCPVDLNEVVQSTMKMLRRMIGEEITVETRLGSGIGRVFADPGQMVQIAMNLAVNARDAMPTGGVLSISTSVEAASPEQIAAGRAGRFVVLSVRDTGSGMTPEVRARVFEPFFTTKGVGRGTGLGLAVVQGIVAESGGFVTIESEVGKGSTFAVHLPEDDRPLEASGTRESASHAARPGERVLVVEDEDSVRRVAVRALRAAGYEVVEAGSGEAALAWLASGQRLDLVLTDVVMPKVDGARVAEGARVLAPTAKILYTSGYTGDAVVRHGVSAAGVAFLSKPYTRASLLRKVREVLDARR